MRLFTCLVGYDEDDCDDDEVATCVGVVKRGRMKCERWLLFFPFFLFFRFFLLFLAVSSTCFVECCLPRPCVMRREVDQ